MQPSGDESRLGVIAETSPIDKSGTDSDDVLECPAKFDARYVFASIDAKHVGTEQGLDRFTNGIGRKRYRRCSDFAGGNFWREVRSGEHSDSLDIKIGKFF